MIAHDIRGFQRSLAALQAKKSNQSAAFIFLAVADLHLLFCIISGKERQASKKANAKSWLSEASFFFITARIRGLP